MSILKHVQGRRPVTTVVEAVETLNEGQRKVATYHSESGKHEARHYKDSDTGEHVVKYYIHGKHHEPADSFHGDKEDAHGTAQHELKRMDRLSGALKEGASDEDLAYVVENMYEDEVELLDELSRKTLSSYVAKATSDSKRNAYAAGGEDQRAADRTGEVDNHGNVNYKPTTRGKAWNNTANKREAGVHKAAARLAKEETSARPLKTILEGFKKPDVNS